MTLHLPTLLYLSIAMLVMSAGIMTLFGATRHVYRGFWWWSGAQWLLALGLLMHGFRDTYPAVLPLANLLVLQWPVVVLAGVRRFYSRNSLRLPPSADWLLLAITYLLWLAAWAAHGSVTTRVAAFALGCLLLHFYMAALLMRLSEFRKSTALKALFGTLIFAGAFQALRLLQTQSDALRLFPTEDLLVASGLVIVLAAMVMVYLGLLLTYERTETNLRATQKKLRFLADIDVLTRVPNRRHFHELATRTLAAGEPARAVLMMFDIDHFKQVNDLLGHASGDEALRQVARCMRDTLRGQDVAGRLGGDEFAVLLPETSVNDAMGVASRIVARLEDRQVAPRVKRISLSFGVVQLKADEVVNDALRRADQALYEAKRQGRSRAVVATGVEAEPVFGESRSLGLTGL